MKICKIQMDANVADSLTNPLSWPNHNMHTRAMGMRYLDGLIILKKKMEDRVKKKEDMGGCDT